MCCTSPAPLYLVADFCEDAASWLDADPRNVVAIHCKAGRGRTGFIVSCFILYEEIRFSALDAINLFSFKRTKDGDAVHQVRSINGASLNSVPILIVHAFTFFLFLGHYCPPPDPLLSLFLL